MTAGIGKSGANTIADIIAQFTAYGVPITATYANQRVTFTNTTIDFPFELLYPLSTCFDVLGFWAC